MFNIENNNDHNYDEDEDMFTISNYLTDTENGSEHNSIYTINIGTLPVIRSSYH
jgi:hypothetical protein